MPIPENYSVEIKINDQPVWGLKSPHAPKGTIPNQSVHKTLVDILTYALACARSDQEEYDKHLPDRDDPYLVANNGSPVANINGDVPQP
ncbi:MAG: hypothetical protein HUU10_04260 [Bacteroidetes bacterium]|nr:hypothetical protein [Cyclobacteriaceae bacterium]NUQ80804.1 hypothetical protein [Bacteroidota bacterium]